MLRIEHLTKKYGDKKAVDDLSLHIQKGEIYGFIGHNGAGKTTTIKSCCGILNFDEGEIYVDGVSVKEKPLECKRKIAYIPDNPDLYEFMTGIKYLNFIADIFGISQSDRQARISKYAEMFEIKKADLNHYKKTNDVSPTEELRLWNELMEQFSYDSEVVKEIQEEIFASQKKIWKEEKKASETALSDYKKHSDAWIKYQVQVNDMGVDEQIESYKRQLYTYNAMVSEMVTSTAYSAEEIKEIWEDFYEYKADVDLKIGKLENEKNYAVYEKWKSDAKNWKNIRDTYDDWDETGDSHIQFYERSIERIQKMYDGGFVGWQEYSDDTMYAVLNLYNAKIEATDTLLDKQKEYINNLKEQFSSEEKALGTKWEVEDRNESKSEISHKLSIYKNAVTQKGMDTYKSLQEQMKKIKREEEMYKLQKTHTATLTSLENSYDTVEANKKYLLATIEKNGMNIEKIVKSVNFDVKNMQSVITSLFNQTISAIKSIKVSSNSYSDNRNISIRGDSRDILNALQNRVGLAVSYGNYN